MVLQFFANISRIKNDQWLKFEHVAMFEHVNNSSGLDHHLGSHNIFFFKGGKQTSTKSCGIYMLLT